MNYWQDIELLLEFKENKETIYKINHKSLLNRYYIVSSPSTRRLLNTPEVVSYEVYKCLIDSTCTMLNYFNNQAFITKANILTILRGALNYPLEEACYKDGIDVHNISFMSSERTFDDKGNVNGLEIKYEKLDALDKSSLLIGDIIASGDTFVNCMKYVIEKYQKEKKELRNIIVFTIGGTRTFDILENLTKEIREIWPNFEGFIVTFYEGVFSCYEDNGYSGINKPMIDFIWRDGIISPEFRKETLSHRDPLFEKCIIYDGGARRYEIKEHIEEVLEFWNGLLSKAGVLDKQTLLEEKLGHKIPIDYEPWINVNHYQKLDTSICENLYKQELDYIASLENISLKEICETRIREFSEAMKKYIG